VGVESEGLRPTSVMIVDDQRYARLGLALMIRKAPDLHVVAEAGDGQEALEVLEQLNRSTGLPDVVLMDVRMPHCDGLEAARRILERDGEREVSEDERVRIIMLTAFDIDEYVYSAVRAGASGFLLKDTPPEQLLEAIRTVHRGDAVIAPSATRRLLEQMIPVLDSPAPVVPTAESVPAIPPAAGSELPKATFIPAEHASFEPVQDYPHRELIEQLSPREFEVLGLIARGLSNAEITRELVLSEATVKTHVSHVLAKLGARDRVQAVIMAYEAGIAH